MTKQTRREFLEYSLLAAAAAAGSAYARTNLAAQQTEPSGSTSPNERVRIAVIGLGFKGRGQYHLRMWKDRSDVEVAALVDPDEAGLGGKEVLKYQEKFGKIPPFFKDLRKVLDDPSIHAVSIAAPNHWHALASIWAIQAGKDVYVEKPVSHNISEGRRIVQTARKHNKIVASGTQARAARATREAIEYIRSGQIGEVLLARGLCYKRRKPIGTRGIYQPPTTVDYNLWLGPAPQHELTRPRLQYDWHWQWDTGNGDIGNQGVHQIDIARWGLGIDDLSGNVFSYGGRFGPPDAGDTPNTQVSMMQFGNKRLVFEVRGMETEAFPDSMNTTVGVIFYGKKGYVVVPYIEKKISYGYAAAFSPDRKIIKEFKENGDHFGNFISAVRNRRSENLYADILEGHLSSTLCHLANTSYRLGSEASAKDVAARLDGDPEAVETFDRVTAHLNKNHIDPANTRFQVGAKLTFDGKGERYTGVRSDEANRMLSRDYRYPFVVPEADNV